MTFLWPVMFAGLLLVPIFIAAYLWMQQRRRDMVARYGNFGLLQGASSRRLGVRRHIPPGLFLLALTILIVALARPQAMVSLPRLEGTVILAFDVSGSMAADDIKPTRLDAAKAAARDFVLRQPSSVQIGVVTFSDAGFATQPPTSEQTAVLAAINRLTVQRGTSLARGVDAAVNVIAAANDKPLTLSDNSVQGGEPTPTPVPKGSYTSDVIVLITDGENTQSPDPFTAVQNAIDRGIRIYTVGVGSTDGATLHIDGFTIRSRLDEATLQHIADVTGGTYYNAETEADLHAIYDNLNPQLVLKPQATEVTSLFAGAGMLVLLIGGMLSLFWLGRVP